MDAIFVPLASATGASLDQVKLISCLLISYPLGSLFIRIPSSQPALKHLFNLAIALFYFVPVLQCYSALLQLLASVIGTYIIARTVTGPRMPWITFVFVMGHLTINHIIRAMFSLSYETFEVTGPQMVLTMKLTTFAWNVWDGRRPVEDLDKWQLQKRITQYPSLLEFLGYSFYFPGVLVGPYLEYVDYKALIDETMFKDVKVDGQRRVPKGRKRVAYLKLVLGLAYLGAFVVLGGKFNFNVATTPWFLTLSLPARIAYYQVAGIFERLKYYAIWTLTEGASILTGLGFTGYGPSGETLWEGAANVNVLEIELPSNFKVLLDSWNMKTNVWLRECVYKRVTPKGKKPGFRSSMITFGTSAFWHGVSSGYYLTFLMGGLITTVGRLSRSNIRPLLLPAPGASPSLTKRIYDLLGTVTSILILNYSAAPFMLLTFENSITAWSRLHWYGHYMIVGSLVFFYAGGSKVLKGAQRRRADALKKEGERRPGVSASASTQSLGSYMVPPIDAAAREVEKKID
ncbi:hypothetical protein PLICRDRAFT_151169 [Plicaturopsis crispa FD-325 SS-3]|nr:hypothetical protein PLICRDRAFT_151169 [Plicaturopsis crispa FD-325 SS-3]